MYLRKYRHTKTLSTPVEEKNKEIDKTKNTETYPEEHRTLTYHNTKISVRVNPLIAVGLEPKFIIDDRHKHHIIIDFVDDAPGIERMTIDVQDIGTIKSVLKQKRLRSKEDDAITPPTKKLKFT